MEPPQYITKQQALEIAVQLCKGDSTVFKCFSVKPDYCQFYVTYPDQPCWYVFVPWDDNQVALQSSRVIVISRLTGKILYDGEAGDEG